MLATNVYAQRLCWLMLFCLALPKDDPVRRSREDDIARRLGRLVARQGGRPN